MSTPMQHDPDESLDTLRSGRKSASRAWGFFVFLACVLALGMTATLHMDSSEPESAFAATPVPPTAPLEPDQRATAQPSAPAPDDAMAMRADSPLAQPAQSQLDAAPVAREPQSPATSTIAFESHALATTEKTVAALFILKRSHPLTGNVLVQWAARSGTADAGIDFSDASGTARFSDGQAQVAIYVPLRNDLLKETDDGL